MMEKIFVTGDLTSFVNRGWKVVPAVMDSIPVTLSLVFGAAILWVVVSIIIASSPPLPATAGWTSS